VMLIENATTGSQSITISQGTGGNVTIATGQVKTVYLDGAGAGAAVVDALADLELGTITVSDLTATTADINGGTIDGAIIGGATPAAGTFTNLTATGTTTLAGASTTADITFGDNDKAIFGAGSDLQIYHDGSDSIIDDNGTGSLKLQTGASTKLEVTSAGINVTGTVTADGLTVNGTAQIQGTGSGLDTIGATLVVGSTPNGPKITSVQQHATDTDYEGLQFYTKSSLVYGDSPKLALQLNANNDISFYEDTGTTAKLFWDASAERLGIGNTSPSKKLTIEETNASTTTVTGIEVANFSITTGSRAGVVFRNYDNYGASIWSPRTGGTQGALVFGTNSGAGTAETNISERMRIDSSGNVGIGTTPAGSVLLDLQEPGSSNDLVVGLSAGTGARAQLRSITQSDGTSSEVSIHTTSSGATNERMRIDSSGNVGIGVTSPTYRIQAATTTSGNGLKITRGADSFFEQFQSTTGGVGLAASGSGAYMSIRTGTTAGTTTEAMRIDSSGNLLVGNTIANPASGFSNQKGFGYTNSTGKVEIATTANDAVMEIGKNNANDGSLLVFRKQGTVVGSINSRGGEFIAIGYSDTYLEFNAGSNQINPSTGSAARDNAIDLGSSGARFDDIYATNSTIQTSDANEKQDVAELDEAERRVAVAAKGLLRKFRWKSSVAEKGDEARIHFGIIAQDLQAAFEAEGLDAGRYAMFIHSTWTDEETGEERSRMGVRYSELLAFIIAAL